MWRRAPATRGFSSEVVLEIGLDPPGLAPGLAAELADTLLGSLSQSARPLGDPAGRSR